ncbi:MAG: hypothetical protein ACOVQ0_07315 [Novosphingobium sp.]|uniref:hypothetical protein n=1 Tax=Novosphingobium sp. TaxID=1874826 RepID=UPI003B9A80A3
MRVSDILRSLSRHQPDEAESFDEAALIDEAENILRTAADEGLVEVRKEPGDLYTEYRVTRTGVDSLRASENEHELKSASDSVNEERASASSEDWTGSRLVYVDSAVLGKIRTAARKVCALAKAVNFESEQDRQDVTGLCEALVALCEMARPEVGIIEQITAHPKFKHYAAFIACIATIRGALGL